MKKVLSKVSAAVFIVLVVFLLSTFVVPGIPAQAATSTPECWAVLVGVSNYQYIDDLDYADDNAWELYQGLGPVWGAEHTQLLTDSQATKANILSAITWLADNADADDTVLFSFSGHGASNGYFCPYNSLTNSYANDISSSQLASAFQPMQAGKTIIILDCCYAGAFQSNLANDGRVIIMATRSYEEGWETGSLWNSVFTYYILQAFDNFDTVDANHDYELSAEEIARYAGPLTSQYEETNYFESIQHPVLDDRYSGDIALLAQFVFNINTSLPWGADILTLDNEPYTSVPSPILWIPGSTHTMTVPQLVNKGSDTRYVFASWSDGDTSVTRVVLKGAYTADYDTEFLLKIISTYGNPQGADWYKEGISASISVTPYIEEPDTRHYFVSWSGGYMGTDATASLVVNAPKTVTANWRNEYLLTVNSAYGDPQGAGWYKDGLAASFSVTPYLEEPDTRHYFTDWSGSYTGDTSTGSLAMNTPKKVTANWRNEYLLTINSEYGQPTGAGWYKEGETAPVSVEPVQGVIIRHIFNGWSGDLSEAQSYAAISINSPKVITATWRTDYIQLYILVGGVGVFVGVIIVITVLVRRSRKVI